MLVWILFDLSGDQDVFIWMTVYILYQYFMFSNSLVGFAQLWYVLIFFYLAMRHTCSLYTQI